MPCLHDLPYVSDHVPKHLTHHALDHASNHIVINVVIVIILIVTVRIYNLIHGHFFYQYAFWMIARRWKKSEPATASINMSVGSPLVDLYAKYVFNFFKFQLKAHEGA